MARVTKDTMIGDLLQIDQNVAPLLLNIGMHCLGCPSSQMESLEDACMVHGLKVEDVPRLIYEKTACLCRPSFICNQYSVKVLPASGWQLLQ